MGELKKNKIPLLLAATLVASCASVPVETRSFQETAEFTEGDYLDKIWFDSEVIAQENYSGVVLASVAALGVSDVKNISVNEAVMWLREGFGENVSEQVPIAGDSSGALARLDLLLTELDPGSTAKRFLAGELGAGHAWIQVEGTLFSADDEVVLAQFVHRTRASGVATFENSRFRDSGPILIKRMLVRTAEEIQKEITDALRDQSQ